MDNRQVDPARREAELALRAARPREPDRFGRRLVEIAWAPCASHAHLAAHGAPASLAELAGRPPIAGLRPELRLVSHEDLRRTARIRAAMEVLGDGIVARAGAFRGEPG